MVKPLKYLIKLTIKADLHIVPVASFTDMSYLTTLTLSHNLIRHIRVDTFHGLISLHVLDLSGNLIDSLPPDVFTSLSNLTLLDVSGNQLQSISDTSFNGLYSLEHLILRDNCLHYLLNDLLNGLMSLAHLDISQNPYSVNAVPPDVLSDLLNLVSISVIHSDICCLKPTIHCMPDVRTYDPLGSCSKIISYKWLEIVSCCFIFVILFCNLGCLGLWIRDIRLKGKARHIFSISLCVADGSLAVYLVLLVSANAAYRDDVGYVALKWKHSALCHLAGTLSTLSVEMSIISTFFIALDKYVCIIVHPFKRKGLDFKFSCALILITWLMVSIAFSLLSFHSQITNSACILVGSTLSIGYATVHILFNSLIFVIMVSIYGIILRIFSKSRQSLNLKIPKRMLLVFGGILISTFITWFTVNVMTIIAISGQLQFPSLEALLGILLFPINGLINPIINRP